VAVLKGLTFIRREEEEREGKGKGG